MSLRDPEGSSYILHGGLVQMMTQDDQDESLSTGAGSRGRDEAELPVPSEVPQEEGQDILVKKDEEIRQLQDRILRMAAEMENTRKRLEREKSECISFANEGMIRGLLPVMDNLERAVQHGEEDATCQGLLEGVRLTLKSFEEVLGKFGCVPFASVGKAFDPNFHEAVMQQESSEHPEKTILQELQKGYTLRDRLLRPAMVIVSKASQDSQR
jgi:molecular chaperone GrpE